MTDATLERDLAGRETIQRLLDAARITGERVIDYGGGRGVWSQGFPTSTVFEPYEEEWGPEQPDREYTASTEGIEPADAILLIAVQQYLSDQDLAAFFTFTREHLQPGGRLLATVASARLTAGWTFSRIQYDGWKALAWWPAQTVWAMLRPVGRLRGYALRRGAFVRLAEQHGLRLVNELPRELDQAYWQMCGAPVSGRGYHWLVLEVEFE